MINPARSSIIVLVVLAFGALSGCRRYTIPQTTELIKEEIRSVLADELRKKNKEKLENLRGEERYLELESRRLEERRARQIRVADAQRLSETNPAGAITQIDSELRDPSKKADSIPWVAKMRLAEKEIKHVFGIDTKEEAHIREIRAQALIDSGRRDKSIEEYRSVIVLDPSRRTARKNLGRLTWLAALREKDSGALIRGINEAIGYWQLDLDEGYLDPDILYFIAQAHYKVYDQSPIGEKDPARLDMARVAMRLALLRGGSTAATLLNAAKARRDAELAKDEKKRAEKTELAERLTRDFESGRESRRVAKETREWLAFLAYEAQDFEEAVLFYESLHKSDPTNKEAIQRLAEGYKRLQNDAKAIEYLEILARVQAPNPEPNICWSLGDLYVKTSRGQAAEWYSRAYRDEASQAPPQERLRIGRLFADAGEIDKGIAWLASIKKGEEGYYDAQAMLAQLYRDLGHDDRALAAYEAMSKVNPTDCLSRLSAADIHLARKDLDEALTLYTIASVLPECKCDGLAGKAEVAYERGNLELAIRIYREVVADKDCEARTEFATALKQIEEELKLRKEAKAAD